MTTSKEELAMAVDIKSLLAAGRFQVPGEDQCTQLQAYWDEVSAQGQQVGTFPGAAEPATTYAAWRAGDD
jgi:hypothetical protein